MFFLAAQIFTWLAIAAAFGGIVGWWLHKSMVSYIDLSPSINMEKGTANSGSISVLSDSLLQTQRELKECQQSLADAESRLGEMGIRFDKNDSEEEKPSLVIESNNSEDVHEAGEMLTEVSTTVEQVKAEQTAVDQDDLTLIFGIGPYIQRRLNEIDISTYQQIANLSEEQIIEVGNYLNYFPGRIERDGWVESAKQLHEEKYGEEI